MHECLGVPQAKLLHAQSINRQSSECSLTIQRQSNLKHNQTKTSTTTENQVHLPATTGTTT
jgi:hypothetical protein